MWLPFTIEKIYAALFGTDSSKAPELDDLNTYFFKHAWPIIGNDVVSAIIEFQDSAFLPKAINCTYVTLLLKVENASSVKNFRHIAHCIVL